jgi:DNA helicase-2/ATP-dependent DNA helicase PcrA
LRPCESIASHPPYLITYQDGEKETVIHAFSCLIQELSDSLPPNGTYKAIGWIGKNKTHDGKLCIPSYFPDYDKSHREQNKRFSNLISYAAYAVQIACADGAKRFLEIILQGITGILDAADIKDEMSGRHYTPAAVNYFWKREHEKSYYLFRQQVAKYFRLALNSVVTPAALRDQIRAAVEPIWPVRNIANPFIDNDLIDAAMVDRVSSVCKKNRFVTDNGIVIHVGTVHSVKGETHTATLYLETEYEKESDASRLIEFLKGNRPKAQIKKAYHLQNLKIAHVAFSRPTHLLAFACRASSITGQEEGLKRNGWIIRTVSELARKRGGTS